MHATTRKANVRSTPGGAAYLPHERSLPVLRKAVQHCRGCEIYRNATQAVFGEMDVSPAPNSAFKAQMMLIGEQPGDREDREGHPFVGPAGRLLDECLQDAGIDRKKLYITNAVKHFKWEPRGKLRIHKKPNSSEIFACRPWLEAELEAVHPSLIVCLGAVAAQSLLGPKFKVTQSHGLIQQVEKLPPVLATFHPAAVLRALKEEDRRLQTAQLIADHHKAQEFVRA
ncbi:MAG TPA: UdgX family uracil-DNA binding protein [Terracidiphilus sp.]